MVKHIYLYPICYNLGELANKYTLVMIIFLHSPYGKMDDMDMEKIFTYDDSMQCGETFRGTHKPNR